MTVQLHLSARKFWFALSAFVVDPLTSDMFPVVYKSVLPTNTAQYEIDLVVGTVFLAVFMTFGYI